MPDNQLNRVTSNFGIRFKLLSSIPNSKLLIEKKNSANSVRKKKFQLMDNKDLQLGKIEVGSRQKDTGQKLSHKELNQMEVEYEQKNDGKGTFEKENSVMKLEPEERNCQKERLNHEQSNIHCLKWYCYSPLR